MKKEKTFNLKNLEEYLMSIFDNNKDAQQIHITQWCKTQGFVDRCPGVDLKLCNDSECVSCSFIAKELQKQLKNYDYSKNISRFNRSKR